MKHILLRVLWLTVLVYACVMGIWGPAGTRATRHAHTNRNAILENLEKLTSLNLIYQEQLAYVYNNPEALALQARSLGYLAPTEVVLRLEKNLVSNASKVPDTGRSLVYVPEPSLTNAQAAEIALVAGLGFLVLLLLLQLFSGLRSRQK